MIIVFNGGNFGNQTPAQAVAVLFLWLLFNGLLNGVATAVGEVVAYGFSGRATWGALGLSIVAVSGLLAAMFVAVNMLLGTAAGQQIRRGISAVFGPGAGEAAAAAAATAAAAADAAVGAAAAGAAAGGPPGQQQSARQRQQRWERTVEALHKLPTDEVATREQLEKESTAQLRKRLRVRVGAGAGKGGGKGGGKGAALVMVEKRDIVDALLAAGGSSGESCCVCCEDYQPGDVLRVLPGCLHVCHIECVDRWLMSSAREYSREPACPVCNRPIDLGGGGAAAGGGGDDAAAAGGGERGRAG